MINEKSLQKFSFFGGILEEQLNKFLPLMAEEQYSPGDEIMVEGTPNDKIQLIIEGKVSIIRKETTIYDMAEGNTFGEMEVLDVMSCAATIKAVTDVTVLSISNTSLRQIYQNDIKSYALLLMNIARNLSRRLRVADDIIINGKTYQAYSSTLFME
jgi:CRP-like cAMP-binding protein